MSNNVKPMNYESLRPIINAMEAAVDAEVEERLNESDFQPWINESQDEAKHLQITAFNMADIGMEGFRTFPLGNWLCEQADNFVYLDTVEYMIETLEETVKLLKEKVAKGDAYLARVPG
jgi:hypothetical protein